METSKGKKYININKMIDSIYNILKSARNAMMDEENKEFLLEEYSDNELFDRAHNIANQCNDEMYSYLHMKDHKICGSMNNIDYDYPCHITGKVQYDHEMVSAMIERLDNEEYSECTNNDRDFLTNWFFETFGTFGISYNFQSEISEFLYMELDYK